MGDWKKSHKNSSDTNGGCDKERGVSRIQRVLLSDKGYWYGGSVEVTSRSIKYIV